MNRYSISLIIFFSFIFLNANEKNVKDFIGFFNFSYDESKDKIYLMVDKVRIEPVLLAVPTNLWRHNRKNS